LLADSVQRLTLVRFAKLDAVLCLAVAQDGVGQPMRNLQTRDAADGVNQYASLLISIHISSGCPFREVHLEDRDFDFLAVECLLQRQLHPVCLRLHSVEDDASLGVRSAGHSSLLDGVHCARKCGREDFVTGSAAGLQSAAAAEGRGTACDGFGEGFNVEGLCAHCVFFLWLFRDVIGNCRRIEFVLGEDGKFGVGIAEFSQSRARSSIIRCALVVCIVGGGIPSRNSSSATLRVSIMLVSGARVGKSAWPVD